MTTIIRAGTAKLADLHPYRRNPRIGDVAGIAASMKRLGQYKPIVVNIGTGAAVREEILAGNHTAQAAEKLGWETIQCVWVDVDDATAERIMLADNRTSDLATYDTDELMALLRELPDLTGTGFTAAQVEPVIPETVEQPNTAGEGVNLFSQRKDWEERETRGIMLDYDLEAYWAVRDLFDKAIRRANVKTPAEALLHIVETVTGEKAR